MIGKQIKEKYRKRKNEIQAKSMKPFFIDEEMYSNTCQILWEHMKFVAMNNLVRLGTQRTSKPSKICRLKNVLQRSSIIKHKLMKWQMDSSYVSGKCNWIIIMSRNLVFNEFPNDL